MAQPLALDHIVIAVNDLDSAITDYRAMGFQVLVGGQHPGRTSHNALIVFADGAYLEIIAWHAPAPEERWYRTLRDHGEGLVDFALLPADTVQALADARARGLDTLTGPLAGGRVRPDGAQLQWQTARHATPDVPFLCGDITPRALRVPEGDVRIHPNGALGVATITVAVHDLSATLARYRALLGAEHAVAPTGDANPAADGTTTATLTVGTLQITLASAVADTQSDAQQTMAVEPTQSPAATHSSTTLRQRLASRGEGPSAVGLHRSAGQPGETLGADTSHGVSLHWATPHRS